MVIAFCFSLKLSVICVSSFVIVGILGVYVIGGQVFSVFTPDWG